MNAAEPCFLTISELSRQIARRQLSPLEATRSVLERIERLDKRLNSYITVMRDEALREAAAAEKAIPGNYLGLLHGVPLSLKDLFCTKGVKTTAGSKVLADFLPQEDATVVARLRAAGAIIVGKTNMHEFAYGPTNDNPHYGPVHNPWDLERIPGGSSGGSAAAVAASLCMGSLGSDTGGSIREPASFCGIVGLKPSYGRVSRHGVLPLSWSLDHAGPMTRTVEDAALIFRAIAGHDPKDPTSSPAAVPDYTQALSGDIRGLRLGIPGEHFFEEIDAEVAAAVSRAITALEGLGARAEPVSLPHARHAPTLLWAIVGGEAASYHEPFFKTRAHDYGGDVRASLEVAQFIPASHYVKAQRVRSLLRHEFLEALRRVDVIVAPTSPVTAPRLGEREIKIGERMVKLPLHLGRLTCPFNLAGLPAISIPCGFIAAGLPIGLQLAGRPFDEEMVLRVAHAYEVNTEWHQMRPKMPE